MFVSHFAFKSDRFHVAMNYDTNYKTRNAPNCSAPSMLLQFEIPQSVVAEHIQKTLVFPEESRIKPGNGNSVSFHVGQKDVQGDYRVKFPIRGRCPRSMSC